MTLGRKNGKVKIKTDGGLRAVECGCCSSGPCGGQCPTLKDLMPNVGTPPQKPTSFNWQVTLSGAAWIIGWTDGDEPEPITTSSISGIADVAQVNWWNEMLRYQCLFEAAEPIDLPGQSQGNYGIFTLLRIEVIRPINSGCSFGISLYTSQEDDVLCSPPLRGGDGVIVSPNSFFGTHSLNYTVNYYLCDESTEPPAETLYRSWQVAATVTIS